MRYRVEIYIVPAPVGRKSPTEPELVAYVRQELRKCGIFVELPEIRSVGADKFGTLRVELHLALAEK